MPVLYSGQLRSVSEVFGKAHKFELTSPGFSVHCLVFVAFLNIFLPAFFRNFEQKLSCT